ncbi:MAG: LysM peptidoglycan-binding domain-containing protein [Parachlamydiaceae bacterium]|nr:LysM peptidoglycan-binding domain-containing protein [Parachlamydiaceae bacterium]
MQASIITDHRLRDTYMRLRQTPLVFIAILLAQMPLAAIPSYRTQNPVPAPNSSPEAIAIRNLRENIDAMRHGQNNHENEIRVFAEKFDSIETIIDSLRSQLRESSRAHKDNLNASASDLDSKIADLELVTKGAASDLRQLKEHANESSNVLTQYQQRLRDLEKVSEQQAQQINNLQSALKAITEILGKDSDDPSSKIYRVKSGDSLEKIANANQTSIKVLKELNNLTNDRIIINQKLKLPEKQN